MNTVTDPNIVLIAKIFLFVNDTYSCASLLFCFQRCAVTIQYMYVARFYFAKYGNSTIYLK